MSLLATDVYSTTTNMCAQFFLINPQEGIGCPYAALRKGPDGLEV
jgi:hypothetical protein